jgi:tripartite-type tricarboxylate transporter receptor subunit TctC
MNITSRNKRLTLAAAAVVGLVLGATLFSGSALAQAWPAKPVHIVVPFAAGGNTDQQARIVAERLSATLGQQFIVENRVGAGGAIAAEYVAKSAPDGYTVLMSAVSQMAILPFIQKVPYDPIKDFAPVSIVGTNPFVLGINQSVPAKTVQEFVAYVKANPGKLNYSSGGNGSIGHLSGALFVQRAGLQMAHIPYKGGAPAVADLVAGVVQMYFGNASELIQHSKSGKITLLGVSSLKRAPQLPGLPAIAETYPGFQTITWNGLIAPAGTPRDVVNKFAAEVKKVVSEPAVVARLDAIGVDPDGSSPEEFAKTIAADIKQWSAAVKAAGIKSE